MIAAMTPQAWMAMWAGVQKVSRPMERCQETSHAPPMEAEVTARAPSQVYQGVVAEVFCGGMERGRDAADVAIFLLVLSAMLYVRRGESSSFEAFLDGHLLVKCGGTMVACNKLFGVDCLLADDADAGDVFEQIFGDAVSLSEVLR